MPHLDALAPEVAGPLGELVDGIWDGRFDPAIVERCRQHLCSAIGAEPLTAHHPKSPTIGSALDDRAFDDRARACAAFTEQWALDPHGVTDELAAAVTDHLSPAECAAFTIALAVLEAQIRAEKALGSLR